MSRFMSPEAVRNLFALGRSNYRPAQIIRTKNAIDVEMRVAMEFSRRTGMIDFARVRVIVALKLQLDRLYAEWGSGFIS